jgi:peptide methionine sulfoxide reductase MsrB
VTGKCALCVYLYTHTHTHIHAHSGTGKYVHTEALGVYTCVGCAEPLFGSSKKTQHGEGARYACFSLELGMCMCV